MIGPLLFALAAAPDTLLSIFAAEPVGGVAAEPIDARESPRQGPLLEAAGLALKNPGGPGWQAVPRARYHVQGRVLRRKLYDDWQAAFAPLDVALGWGAIGDRRVDDWLSWRQAGRWYYFRRPRNTPLSRSYIRDHSANVHLIPASDNLRLALQRLRRNDLILLEGMLVDVETDRAGKSYLFRTSLSRRDEGPASCEILYVERLVIGGREYR